MPKRLRLTATRNVRGTLVAAKPKADTTITIEQSGARQIQNLPPHQRDLVIASLKEGTKPGLIATFFADQGWLEVTEKTFRQYIMHFRKVYPELITGVAPDNIDFYADPKTPHLDEEQTLDQLIRVQKIRLKRGLDFEARTQLPMKDLYKDIETTRVLIETKANMAGRGKGSGKQSGKASVVMTNEASESLRQSDTAEASQDKMANLTSQLVPLMRQKFGAQTKT